jgi:hypothetical protein
MNKAIRNSLLESMAEAWVALRMVVRRRAAAALGGTFLLAAALATPPTQAAGMPKTPAQFLGRELYDVRMPSWSSIVAYHQHLSETSDRVQLEVLAHTDQGRPIILATVSSPQNLARIEEIRRIQLKLADPRTIAPGELEQLIAAGKPVLLVFAIDGGQVGAYLSQIAFLHQLATSQTSEVQQWLDNTVVLFMNSSDPDSVDVVQQWVERTYGTPWQGASRPGGTFYGEVGRDIDSYAMRETQALAGVMRRWQPNVTHDVHTMGSVPRYGARLFTPPFVGPVPSTIHPLLWQLQGELGMTMASRVLEGGMSGVTYDMHYDITGSGMYFFHHHALRTLTEASPPRMTTPIQFRLEDLVASPDWPDPRKPGANFPVVWPGGEWGLEQIIEYSTAALAGELNHIALNRERYLRLKHKVVSESMARKSPPYAFLIPAQQHDPSSLRDMLEMLRVGEVEVRRTSGAAQLDGVQYQAGDYVVRLDQPFGNWAQVMLEPMDFPVLRSCGTCAITPPYDVSTTAYPPAMGVNVAPINTPLQMQTELVSEIVVSGSVAGASKSAAYLLSPNQNAAFKAVGRLLKSGASVSRLRAATTIGERSWPAGSYVITGSSKAKLQALAQEQGLDFVGVDTAPDGASARLTLPRVAVYQTRVSGRNGWPRLLLPEYELPLNFVYDADVRRGDLRKRFDVVILPALVFLKQYKEGNAPGTYPPDMVGGLGTEGLRGLNEFARAGGTVIALDDAVELLVTELNLPVKFTSGFTMSQMDRPVPTNKIDGVEFAIPGSFLRMRVADTQDPLTYGMPEEFAGMFNRAPLLEPTGPDAKAFVVYPRGKLLISGMAVGEQLLQGKAAAVDVRVGAGHVVLFAVRPELRMQTHGTYKLLFNTIYESTARETS